MENYREQRANAGSPVAQVLAVIGILALLVIGMWGSVTVASAVPGGLSRALAALVSFSSIFVPASETITVNGPSGVVTAHTPFTLTFAHSDKSVQGSYRLRYLCADGISLNSAVNGSDQTVFCNVPFNFNAQDAITLVGSNTSDLQQPVEMFIDFTPNGVMTPTVTGSTAVIIGTNALSSSTPVSVTPTPAPTPKPKPTPRPTTPTTTTYPVVQTSGQVSDPNGYVDLTARVIEVGYVDKTTGAFTASSTPSRQNRIAVRFAVENLGTKRSPSFAFNAVLPTIPSHIFSAPPQQELNPGDRIEFTIGFDTFVDALVGDITINVDPTNSINERNKDNNIIHYTLHATN